MWDGFKIMIRIADRGAALKVLDEPVLDLATPSGRGLLVFLSSLAEEERQRVVQRAADGRKAVKGAYGFRLWPRFMTVAVVRIRHGSAELACR